MLGGLSVALAALETENAANRAQRFARTFQKVVKRDGATNRSIASGGGSTREYTLATRSHLHTVVTAFGVRSILDIPCGDFQWMPIFLDAHPEIRYFGADIVRALIAEHTSRFSDRPQWAFGVADMVRDFPAGEFDLVHMRDALQHLSPGDAVSVITSLRIQSRFRYWMVTDYEGVTHNRESRIRNKGWDFQYHNLRLPPYSLPPPLMRFNESADGKTLALYRIPF
jgi:SAM-dependent methyltransferase